MSKLDLVTSLREAALECQGSAPGPHTPGCHRRAASRRVAIMRRNSDIQSHSLRSVPAKERIREIAREVSERSLKAYWRRVHAAVHPQVINSLELMRDFDYEGRVEVAEREALKPPALDEEGGDSVPLAPDYAQQAIELVRPVAGAPIWAAGPACTDGVARPGGGPRSPPSRGRRSPAPAPRLPPERGGARTLHK